MIDPAEVKIEPRIKPGDYVAVRKRRARRPFNARVEQVLDDFIFVVTVIVEGGGGCVDRGQTIAGIEDLINVPRRAPFRSSEARDTKKKRAQVALQIQQAMKPSPTLITCGCGFSLPIRFAFKCLYCAEWFCNGCGEAHWGMTASEYQALRDAPPFKYHDQIFRVYELPGHSMVRQNVSTFHQYSTREAAQRKAAKLGDRGKLVEYAAKGPCRWPEGWEP